MKNVFFVFLLLALVSCATGPVHVAKNEAESIKRVYDEPMLGNLYAKHQNLLNDIYRRFTRDRIDFYKEGLGFTAIKDLNGKRHPYLMVYIRPSEVSFDENATKPNRRLAAILNNSYKKYIAYIDKKDVQPKEIEGLAFGIYWPVRDYSQCDKYGGFIEYAIVFFGKDDLYDIKDGKRSIGEVMEETEVVVSLDLKEPVSIRPIFELE